MKKKRILALLLAFLFTVVGLSSGAGVRAEGDNDIQYAPRDVVFVIDNSGSMKQTDPDEICKTTIKAGIDYMDYGDQVGVVAYSLDAENTFNLREIRDENDKTEVKKFAENSLTRDGKYTDISSGIAAAAQMLEERGLENHGKSIILVSDGENDVDGSGRTNEEIQKKLDEALAKGYEVNIIGMNAQKNEVFKTYLEDIAKRSGGEARFPENVEKAKEDIAYFISNTRGEEYPVNSDILINIPSMTFQATIWVQYQDELEIVFKDPTGAVMNEGSDYTLSQSNGNFIIKVLQPDEGTWTLFLKAPKEGTARLFQSIQNPDVKATATASKTGEHSVDVSGILSFQADQNGTMVTTTIDNLAEYPKLSAKVSYMNNGVAEEKDMTINGNQFVASLDGLDGSCSFTVEVNANGYSIVSEKVDVLFEAATTAAPATTEAPTTEAPTTEATTTAAPQPKKNGVNPIVWIIAGVVGLGVIGTIILLAAKGPTKRGPKGQIVIRIENDKEPRMVPFNKSPRDKVNLYESILESIDQMQDKDAQQALRAEVVKLQSELKSMKVLLELDKARAASAAQASRVPNRTAGASAAAGRSGSRSGRPGSTPQRSASAGRPSGPSGRPGGGSNVRSNVNAKWVLSKNGRKVGINNEQIVFERAHGAVKKREDSSIRKITIKFNQSMS